MQFTETESRAYAARARQADSSLLRWAYVWGKRGLNPSHPAMGLIRAELARRVTGPKGKLP